MLLIETRLTHPQQQKQWALIYTLTQVSNLKEHANPITPHKLTLLRLSERDGTHVDCNKQHLTCSGQTDHLDQWPEIGGSEGMCNWEMYRGVYTVDNGSLWHSLWHPLQYKRRTTDEREETVLSYRETSETKCYKWETYKERQLSWKINWNVSIRNRSKTSEY